MGLLNTLLPRTACSKLYLRLFCFAVFVFFNKKHHHLALSLFVLRTVSLVKFPMVLKKKISQEELLHKYLHPHVGILVLIFPSFPSAISFQRILNPPSLRSGCVVLCIEILRMYVSPTPNSNNARA